MEQPDIIIHSFLISYKLNGKGEVKTHVMARDTKGEALVDFILEFPERTLMACEYMGEYEPGDTIK